VTAAVETKEAAKEAAADPAAKGSVDDLEFWLSDKKPEAPKDDKAKVGDKPVSFLLSTVPFFSLSLSGVGF
jgi:hypothetical protein